jgi:ribonuclease PH
MLHCTYNQYGANIAIIEALTPVMRLVAACSFGKMRRGIQG